MTNDEIVEGQKADKPDNKPPDRAEWERMLHVAWSDVRYQTESAYQNIRAAVQRALDKREAVTWRDARDSVSASMNTGRELTLDPLAFMDFANEKAAAAEARARRDDGD